MIAAGTYKITRQGQITIPASIREDLGLREGDVLDFFYADDLCTFSWWHDAGAIFVYETSCA